MHVNEEFAAATPFGGRIAHDMLLASAHAFLTLRQLTWGTELFGPLLLTEEIVREAPAAEQRSKRPRAMQQA
jgi:muconate cycloisomerase